MWCQEVRLIIIKNKITSSNFPRACFRDGFPGSQPVSLDRDNICLISEKAYHVSWKADGTRYMMLIAGKDEVN